MRWPDDPIKVHFQRVIRHGALLYFACRELNRRDAETLRKTQRIEFIFSEKRLNLLCVRLSVSESQRLHLSFDSPIDHADAKGQRLLYNLDKSARPKDFHHLAPFN